MPISVQLTEGLLTPEGEREVFARVADALLAVHGLKGSARIAPAQPYVRQRDLRRRWEWGIAGEVYTIGVLGAAIAGA